jgi:hypothetical protein
MSDINKKENTNIYPYEPDFSLKKLILDRKDDLKYLLKFKKKYLVVVLIGTILGAVSSWLWPVSYTSRVTFIIEDSKSSGGSLLSGLAGQFGLDMAGALGGTSGVLAGDNVMALLKSESMVKQTLLTPFTGDKNSTLADQYAKSHKLISSWNKLNNNKPLKFPINRSSYSRLQDSLLQDMTIRINENNLSIIKPDKKLGFFELTVKTKNEKFSQLFSTRIIEKATDFYISTKLRTKRINVDRLQRRADSISLLLNKKTFSTSAANQILLDVNPAFPTTSVGVEKEQRDKLVLQTVYGEIIKNLEISRTLLIQETPTFQIVDYPDLPLKLNRLKYPKGIVFGIIFAVFAYSIYLLASRKSSENQNTI